MAATETLPVLNGKLMQHQENDPSIAELQSLPEKVLQFGEGDFLRGFVDWMIDGMNRTGYPRGEVEVSVEQGRISRRFILPSMLRNFIANPFWL